MTVPRKTPPFSPAEAKASAGEHHFRTDHLLGDIRKHAVSGGVVTSVAQAIKLALTLGSGVAMARLLTPEDFGLIAMVGSITGFLLVFKDAGLSTATIQKAQITHAQVSNLFWINLSVSAALSLLIAVLAPAVAWFYRDARMVMVTLALAGTFVLSGAVVQHQALLNRQLRFKALAVIDISSTTFGMLAGVTMACLKFGYWSLVGMQLATGFAELAMTLWISRWRPQRPVRGTGTRSLLQFGASLTVASVFRRISSGCDSLLLGRSYGAAPVGLYTRASSLFIRPLGQLTGPFESVFTPILSHLQGDPGRYRRTFLKAYGAAVLVWFPITGLLFALSGPLVLALLGPKWEKAIPIFAWLSLSGLFVPLYCFVMCLLNTQGRGKDIMIMGLIFSATTVGAVFAGLPFGPVGVALATSCVGLLVRLPVQFYIVGRSGPVGTADLWAVPLKYLPNWGVVVGATYLTLHALPPNCSPIVQLGLGAPVGMIAGLLVAFGVPAQRREAFDLWALLKPFILRRKSGGGVPDGKAKAPLTATTAGPKPLSTATE